MQYLLIGGAVLVALLLAAQLLRTMRVRQIARAMRWLVGGALALFTLLLLARGQIGLASVSGPVAFVILRYGRLGRFSFESTEPGDDNQSTVKSRFFSMRLDHDSGDVAGRVVAGRFRGRDLAGLDEFETRVLLDEVAVDPDSLALLETWLDRNRAGWREYFDAQDAGEPSGGLDQAADPDAEAYEILGLDPGASADEIRAAHRKLIMAVHPDQGGSEYLAARINAAKDRLLARTRSRS